MPTPALGPDDIGQLVTLRVAGPAGAADVVGTLVAASATELSVRRRDGAVVAIPVADVTHARRVPPGPARLVDAMELHRVMAAGWRALESADLGGWLLRASGGFTRRGNSALPLGDPGRPLRAALDAVDGWYAERELSPRVQVPQTPATTELTAALAAAGWTNDSQVHVMTAEIGPALRAEADTAAVRLDDTSDDAWVAAYRREAGPLPPVAHRMLANHPQVVFASVRDNDECVAIARGTVDGRWAGLFAVEVHPSHRRLGLGRAVSVAALRWAARHGARRAYLQTWIHNDPALALYRTLGFEVHHDYHHWVRQ